MGILQSNMSTKAKPHTWTGQFSNKDIVFRKLLEGKRKMRLEKKKKRRKGEEGERGTRAWVM